MFTGIIEDKGIIILITKESDLMRISIKTSLSDKIQPSDSISVDGVCLTVVDKKKDSFTVEAIKKTFELTTLKNKKKGDIVNLETSLTLNKLLGGHIVLGHVDCEGKLIDIQSENQFIIHKYKIPVQYTKYIVPKGSIAINGTSLTISEIENNSFCVNIIPYTLSNTNLGSLKRNDYVNIEFDIIGKYIYNLITKEKNGIMKEQLEEKIKLFLEGN
jgi:riboflavin synthase